jgi:ribosomal protein L11 methyltransferase
MEAGSLGTEFNDSNSEDAVVTAYFDQLPDRERIRSELLRALQIYSLPTSAARDLQLREVRDQDWLAEWKKTWQPITVGRSFVVAPPWSEISDSEGRIVIRIEPGMAFGTGTHETTRLCLKAIENHFRGGSFLDIGTGTGILAIAAAKRFGHARITACDVDPDAILIARENARLNQVDNITFVVGSLDPGLPSADCVCANLTTVTILQLLPQLIAATCGRLILSGILTDQLETVTTALQQQGVSDFAEVEVDGEWACVVV